MCMFVCDSLGLRPAATPAIVNLFDDDRLEVVLGGIGKGAQGAGGKGGSRCDSRSHNRSGSLGDLIAV